MLVEPKTLIRRLTPTATRVLEAAVGRAATGRLYEITPEHLLLALVEAPEGEPARVLAHFEQDRERLATRIARQIERMKSGNPGRPVFADAFFQWIEDAWVVASIEHGAGRVRTGMLFAQFVARGARYSGESYPEIDAIPAERLKRELADILAPSREGVEAEGDVAGRAAGGAAAGGAAGSNPDSALARFTTSFTARAREGKLDPVFGRDDEIRQLIDILVRRRKNNPIVVGEPGVGKTALVEGLALAIVAGEVPEVLRNVDLIALDMGLLQAGASVKGEFENRLKNVIAEVKASPRPIVVFIDEAHTLIGAGGQAGGSDAANLLKPALARGELRTIAATTWAEYKKYFEKDAALERRFQPVKLDEPSVHDATVMLRGLRELFEKAHGVPIRDEAIVAAVQLSHRYITGRQLPDKAVDLLDTAGARVRIELVAKPEPLVALEARLEALRREHAGLSRDAGDGAKVDAEAIDEAARAIAQTSDALGRVRARWESERTAVEAVWKARAALAAATAGEDGAAATATTPGASGADVTPLRAELARARAEVVRVRGTGPEAEPMVHAEVDADVVARIVASWTGIPVGKMSTDAIASVLGLESRLRERVRGQEAAVTTLAEVIRIANAGIRNPDAPLGSLLFVGPSGVGKTETAAALADVLYGGERFMTVINMSEFQEKHTVSRLIGSPPGYVGYGEGGVLTEALRQRPYSVVLLDEVEKADLEVMNLFYQVFDKGTLSDGEGRVIDCRNAVFILTSNLATDAIVKAYEADEPPTADAVASLIRPVLSKHFKPALLARMTIVPFGPIAPAVMREIAQLKLGRVIARLREAHRIETTVDPALVGEIARRCTESETGARNVDAILRSTLVPRISLLLLERLAAGDPPRRLALGLDPSGDFRTEFDAPSA